MYMKLVALFGEAAVWLDWGIQDRVLQVGIRAYLILGFVGLLVHHTLGRLDSW